MCGDDSGCCGISLICCTVIVCLEDLRLVKLRYQLVPLVQLALGSGYTAGNGIHGHDQETCLRIRNQVVVDGVVGQPLTVGLTDHIAVDAHPGCDLLAVYLQRIIRCHHRNAGLGALIDNRLGHGLIRYTDGNAGCLVGNGIVHGLQTLLRAHLGIHIGEAAAGGLYRCLGGLALVDEPGLITGLVNAVNGLAAEVSGAGALGCGLGLSRCLCCRCRGLCLRSRCGCRAGITIAAAGQGCGCHCDCHGCGNKLFFHDTLLL